MASEQLSWSSSYLNPYSWWTPAYTSVVPALARLPLPSQHLYLASVPLAILDITMQAGVPWRGQMVMSECSGISLCINLPPLKSSLTLFPPHHHHILNAHPLLST